MRSMVMSLAGALAVTVATSAPSQVPTTEPTPPVAAWAPLLPGKLSVGGVGHGAWALGGWQEPRDSLYQQARELLNRGEYRRSADLFRDFRQKNAESRYAAPAMYWQAFALYRAGSDADLRAADELLVSLRQQSTRLADESEVRSLATRVSGALAARGDASAARRLRESAGVESGCDREDTDIKAEALSALLQADPNSNLDVLRRVVAKKDECSVALRRRSVGHLNRIGGAGARALLADIAANDPSPEVRGEAIGGLAQQPGGAGVALIGPLLDQVTDDQVLRASLLALSRVADGDANVNVLIRRVIERNDVSEKVRADAIRSLVRRQKVTVTVAPPRPGESPAVAEMTRSVKGQSNFRLADADASYLKGLYDRTPSPVVRRAIVEAMTTAADAARDGWVLGLLRNPNTESRDRSALLASLRRSDIAIVEVIKLYDAMSERESRSMLVGILGSRDEPAATDKLVEIAKRGTDPSIRREAIVALTRKNDPRATKLLLELVEQ
ncbi:MAG: HEAT repeat domain-containing protein [Gemmatimonadales bacterium]